MQSLLGLLLGGTAALLPNFIFRRLLFKKLMLCANSFLMRLYCLQVLKMMLIIILLGFFCYLNNGLAFTIIFIILGFIVTYVGNSFVKIFSI